MSWCVSKSVGERTFPPGSGRVRWPGGPARRAASPASPLLCGRCGLCGVWFPESLRGDRFRESMAGGDSRNGLRWGLPGARQPAAPPLAVDEGLKDACSEPAPGLLRPHRLLGHHPPLGSRSHQPPPSREAFSPIVLALGRIFRHRGPVWSHHTPFVSADLTGGGFSVPPSSLPNGFAKG